MPIEWKMYFKAVFFLIEKGLAWLMLPILVALLLGTSLLAFMAAVYLGPIIYELI